MDPSKHVQQGVSLLNRVLQYASMVREDGEALVGLTEQDWYVVSDLLFRMDVPDETLPEEIEAYTLSDDQKIITLSTPDGPVRVERT
jgi:hypothetical protein